MKITDIVVSDIYVPLHNPFKTAIRTVDPINNCLVYIHTNTGQIGIGEAAPTAVITGETKESIAAAIHYFIKPAIIGMEIENIEGIMQKLHKSIYRNTSAKAAVDMAVYDLFALRYEAPLYKILGGYKNHLKTDITISLNSIEEMIIDSLNAVERGFDILKIKVGSNSSEDIERIIEIRNAVGEEIVLRVDANQAWTAKEAVKIITRLEDLQLNIELVEQPVAYDDIEGMKYVTEKTYTKILADESVFSLKDALTVIEKRAADCINIKLMKTGGIYNAIQLCHLTEMNNIECMIGCMLESKISVSAAAHVAAAKKNITMVDLDGPSLCVSDPISGGPVFTNQLITMTDDFGLGFSI